MQKLTREQLEEVIFLRDLNYSFEDIAIQLEEDTKLVRSSFVYWRSQQEYHKKLIEKKPEEITKKDKNKEDKRKEKLSKTKCTNCELLLTSKFSCEVCEKLK